MLEAEFEAFQSGHSLENGPLASEALLFDRAANPFPPELAQTSPPDWASDFQRFHIVDTQAPPIPQSQFPEQDPLERGSQEGWHDEFSRQQNSVFNRDAHQQTPAIRRGYIPPTNPYSAYDQIYSPGPPGALQRQPGKSSKISFDDVAIERAFREVSTELNYAEEYAQGQETEHGQEASLVNDIPGKSVQAPELKGALLTERIGSDKILEVPKEEREKQARNDADELARTAGELLDNVKHDQSRKFRESNFLSLMRQLRDREVQVEGDKIVEVSIPLSQS